MRVTFSWSLNKEFLFGKPRRLQSSYAQNLLMRAVGMAAIAAQEKGRQNLQQMVYSQPPAASGYIRTGSLMRGMGAHKASRPDTGQGAAAIAGKDLAQYDPMAVVERRGMNEFRTAVSNPVKWAEYVHDGVRQPEARPFMDGIEDEYDNELGPRVDEAIREISKL